MKITLKLLITLSLIWLAPSCLDGPIDPVQGDRGFPCQAHESCLAPLVCLDVPDVDFLVCTGTALENQACSSEMPCAWVRDSRGLPLTCQSGFCNYPAEGSIE